MSVQFIRGLVSITLPNPVLGDSQIVRPNAAYQMDMAGAVHSVIKDSYDRLQLGFTVLTEDEKDALLTFHETYVASEVIYRDHNGDDWAGYLPTTITVATARDGCSYSTTFEFSGAKT